MRGKTFSGSGERPHVSPSPLSFFISKQFQCWASPLLNWPGRLRPFLLIEGVMIF